MLLLVSVALACPMCGAPNSGDQGAWAAMSAFLSLVPLLFMGLTIYWIARRVAAAEAADRPPPSSVHAEGPTGPGVVADATPKAVRYTGAPSPT